MRAKEREREVLYCDEAARRVNQEGDSISNRVTEAVPHAQPSPALSSICSFMYVCVCVHSIVNLHTQTIE